jgi:hypothetical protein
MKTTTDAPRMLTWHCEHRDPGSGGYGGCVWERHQTITLPIHATDRATVRAGKAALGLTGVRCRTSHLGGCEGFELRPYGSSTVAFITLGEKE